MIIPGILAQQGLLVGGGGGALWTPLNMATPPQIYLDAQDSVVTDVSGACSAISNLGGLGVNGDFSQATAANRPAILNAELNGRRVLRFDGANDVLVTTDTPGRALFANAAAAWIFSVYKKRSVDASPTARYLLFSGTGSGAVRFGLLSADATAGRANKPRMYARRLDADAPATLDSPNAVAGDYVLSLALTNFATREGVLRENGAQVALNSALTASAGNTSNTVASTPTSIGAFNTGSFPSDVDLAAVLIANVAPAVGEVEKLEGWAAHRWGLAANLPVGHPYKSSPPTV